MIDLSIEALWDHDENFDNVLDEWANILLTLAYDLLLPVQAPVTLKLLDGSTRTGVVDDVIRREWAGGKGANAILLVDARDWIDTNHVTEIHA